MRFLLLWTVEEFHRESGWLHQVPKQILTRNRNSFCCIPAATGNPAQHSVGGAGWRQVLRTVADFFWSLERGNAQGGWAAAGLTENDFRPPDYNGLPYLLLHPRLVCDVQGVFCLLP